MNKRIFLFIFTFVWLISYSQTDKIERFKKIDSLSKIVKFNNNLPKLVNDLTNFCNSNEEKYRAIFIWISDNISYDFKTFNKNPEPEIIKCKEKEDCQIKMAKLDQEIIDRVLNRKIAICDGYSKLFKRMCDIANLNCAIIEGYVKNSPNHIGSMGILNHAWNMIKIDNENYFLDVTWASGYCTKNDDGKLDSFVKKFNNYYWLTDSRDFTRDHFPKNALWLNGTSLTKNYYKNQPYIEVSEMPFLKFINPESGIINVRKGEKIKFEFNYDELVDKIQINTNLNKNPSIWKIVKGERILDEKAFEKQKYIDYQKTNNKYRFEYNIDDEKLKYIDILFDHNLVAKFKITLIP